MRIMRAMCAVVCCLLGWWSAAGGEGDEAAPSAAVVLSTASPWRAYTAWRTPVFGTDESDATPREKTEPVPTSPPPPADWMEPDFDDADWGRQWGPLYGGDGSRQPPTLALICLRAKFKVSDPAQADELRLTLAYRGGAVVYLNGTEVARGHLPASPRQGGRPSPWALAAAYPAEAYRAAPDEAAAVRIRTLAGVKVSASLLRPGTNVLAVELHRAPLHPDADQMKDARRTAWGTVGLVDVRLSGGGAAVAPNVARPPGIQVWTSDVIGDVVDETDYGDPNEALRPIRLTGARNGAFSAAFVLSGDAPIRDLGVVPAALKLVGGEGVIPASAVQVRYALPDGTTIRRDGGRAVNRFDTLAESPRSAALVNPIWLTVRVPADAASGAYEGAVTVRAEGLEPVAVPVHLTVADWRLPHPKDFDTFADLIQSPDSVALQYGVDLWSERHFDLIGRSFDLLGQVGARTVYLPLVCKTHFGNDQTMVRWVAGPDGSYTYDFAVIDRYLDLYLERVGSPKVVCLYAWDKFLGGGYYGREGREAVAPEVTLLDPKTGQGGTLSTPLLGSAESEAFWRPVFDQVRERLRRRGIADESVMIGLAGDAIPTQEIVDLFGRLMPNARWVVHRHGHATKMRSAEIGFLAHVWGGRNVPDPAVKRLYGWQNRMVETVFPRPRPGPIGALGDGAHFAVHRLIMEAMLMAGYRGFGRVGADFWPVLPDARGRKRTIIGRYPGADWHQLSIGNSTSKVLSPGPDGARPTIRFEMIRQGVQEAQARIFIEQALIDETSRARLGDDLAARCQAVLDARARAFRTGYATSWEWFEASGWQERNARLFQAAAEVARALDQPQKEHL